ncbi:MAG: alcohol dehydrogenase catalytic domain-containing protein [Parachlamydiaceae bacterium]
MFQGHSNTQFLNENTSQEIPKDLATSIWNGRNFELRPTKIYNRNKSTIVKVLKAGFCGTDHHFIERPNLSTELSLGHEILAELVQVGEHIKSVGNQPLKVGDRVVVIPGIACGGCHICLSYGGHENMCNHRSVHGFSKYSSSSYFPQGGFSNYMELLDNLWVYKVPENIPTEYAMFGEPLAIGVKAIERALGGGRPDRDLGPGLAPRAAIIGLGPIGCIMAYMLQSINADIVGVDIDPWKAKFAGEVMGIDTLHVPEDARAADELFKQKFPDDFDIVLECGGTAKAFELSILLPRKGGKVIELGNYILGDKAHIDPAVICRKELDISGSVLAPPFIYSKVFRILQKQDPSCLSKLVTHTIKLSEMNTVMDILESKKYMKIFVEP